MIRMFHVFLNDQSYSYFPWKKLFTISITSGPFNIDWLIFEGEQLWLARLNLT